MVYAIIYVRPLFPLPPRTHHSLQADTLSIIILPHQSLFLGFGIAIGSDFFFLVDPSARRANLAAAKAANQMITVMGQFVPDNQNGTSPMFAGSFVFS